MKTVPPETYKTNNIDYKRTREAMESLLKIVDEAGLLVTAARLSHTIDSLDEEIHKRKSAHPYFQYDQ